MVGGKMSFVVFLKAGGRLRQPLLGWRDPRRRKSVIPSPCPGVISPSRFIRGSRGRGRAAGLGRARLGDADVLPREAWGRIRD